MKDIIESLKKLDTPSVSDALDKLGIPCGLYGIKPVNLGSKMCGEAFTVHYVPCGEVKGTVGDFLDDIKPGQVAVLDNGGRDYCTVWGDIMAWVASKKGIAGTVIDGVCRDIPVVRETGYAMFTKGYYMVTGKDRVEVDATNIPVSISGVKVCPGDIILGDDSGAIVIPKDRAIEVLEIAENIEKTERHIIELVKEGNTLKEARKITGYHKLQTNDSKLKVSVLG
ncbi:RraA family protein [Sedimentibacter saalensis]|uniref:RraA family protein n=1 Tax=Sedimentibacter saalensis TaxID=130788 RepID=UPI00289F6C90|nr:RraA family protein [Sedimentibacter saalensis]